MKNPWSKKELNRQLNLACTALAQLLTEKHDKRITAGEVRRTIAAQDAEIQGSKYEDKE